MEQSYGNDYARRYGQPGLRVFRITGDVDVDSAIALYIAAQQGAARHPYDGKLETPLASTADEKTKVGVAYGELYATATANLAAELERYRSRDVIEALGASGIRLAGDGSEEGSDVS